MVAAHRHGERLAAKHLHLVLGARIAAGDHGNRFRRHLHRQYDAHRATAIRKSRAPSLKTLIYGPTTNGRLASSCIPATSLTSTSSSSPESSADRLDFGRRGHQCQRREHDLLAGRAQSLDHLSAHRRELASRFEHTTSPR
jgi:hypothetical protein